MPLLLPLLQLLVLSALGLPTELLLQRFWSLLVLWPGLSNNLCCVWPANAWLILQHCNHSMAWQRCCAVILRRMLSNAAAAAAAELLFTCAL